MEQFFKAIEKIIADSGYPEKVSGEEIYEDIISEIEDKENGSYIFMSKKSDDVYYEYRIQVYKDDFNLSSLVIHTKEKDWTVNFD